MLQRNRVGAGVQDPVTRFEFKRRVDVEKEEAKAADDLNSLRAAQRAKSAPRRTDRGSEAGAGWLSCAVQGAIWVEAFES